MPDLFRFEWPVDQAGYELVHVAASQGGSLLSGQVAHDIIRARDGAPRYYRPLDDPGLWRRFADSCESAYGVLAFVTEFGLLAETRSWSNEQGERLDSILNTAELIRQIAQQLDAG